MTELQLQLQNALTTTFLANLAFLSEYDNELYHRVDELSRMIGNGTYQEKYALEFISENGDFDIFDIVNNQYLYKKNPKKINHQLIKKINFDNQSSIHFIEEYFKINYKPKVDYKERFNFKEELEFISLVQNDIYEYINLLGDYIKDENIKIKKVDKFIFLGTLLGRHIPEIAKKIDAKFYLILERNLEIFRLSLFTVDYKILAKNGAVFSIMDTVQKEEEKIQLFLKNDIFNNYMIKFSTTNINIDRYIDNINASLNIVNNSAQYVYSRYLYSFVNRVTKVLNNEYKILLLNKINLISNIFNNVPILYLAAGPSLDENIEWIKKNQNKFFIVTVGAAYKKLIKNDIRIDMISTLDEKVEIGNIQFDDNSVTKIDKKTIILASVITHKSILNKFNKDNLFLYEVFSPFYKSNKIIQGYSVGEITLGILLEMKPKKLYLIGLDLALNQNTGLSHSKDSSSIVNQYNLAEVQIKEEFTLRKGLLKVKGNLKEEINTISIFFNSIKALDEILLEKSEMTNIYNLSSNGAYFENTIPLSIDDLNENSFVDIKIDKFTFRKILEQCSFRNLDEESKNDLNEDISILKEILEKHFFEFRNNKIEKYEDFYQYIIDMLPIFKSNNRIIFTIIRNYLMMVLPYLSFYFNTKKIRKEKIKIEQIKEIFIKHIRNIIIDYIFCLERIAR